MSSRALERFVPEGLPNGWSQMRICEAIEELNLPIDVYDDEEYLLASIRRRFGGMFHRERLYGRKILTKNMQRVKPGSFVIARMQIVHGACALADERFRDHIISKSYSSFGSTEHCDIRYFSKLARQPFMSEYFRDASHGVVIEKMTFQQDRWMQMPIWLPPIEEQQYIIEILETIDETIQASERVITKLRLQLRGTANDLLTFGQNWEHGSVGSLLAAIDSGKSPIAEDRPPGPAEWGVLKVSAVHHEGFRPQETKTVPAALVRKDDEVRHGDVLMTRANTTALVGMCCYVNHPPPRLQLSDKTLRLVPNYRVRPKFLALLLQSPNVRAQIERDGTGSSGSMKNISQQEIRSLTVSWPDRQVQDQILGSLGAIVDRIEAEADHLAKLEGIRSGLADDLLSGRIRTVAA